MRTFFFQAEDGIRDLTVTGVQTCALPIIFLLSERSMGGQPKSKASSWSSAEVGGCGRNPPKPSRETNREAVGILAACGGGGVSSPWVTPEGNAGPPPFVGGRAPQYRGVP